MSASRFASFCARRVKTFGRDDSGTVLTEFVMIFPILIWAWIGMFFYWDIYRAVNLAQKASFTIADNLSRDEGVLDAAYINGVNELFAYLADTDQEVRMRVTSVGWNRTTQKHEVSWSYSPHGKMTPHTNASLAFVANRIPTLVDYETVILLETSVDYAPPFDMPEVSWVNLGVGARTMEEFIVTRPRFINKICLLGTPCV